MPADKHNVMHHIGALSLAFLTPAGRRKVLRDISLDLGRGRILGIVGESGCGKSTLISTVMRLLPANAEVTHGEILFNGNDLLRKSEAELRALRGGRISMVLQDPMASLNPVLSIGRQMIAIPPAHRRSLRENRERAAALLARARIPDATSRLSAYPHNFS